MEKGGKGGRDSLYSDLSCCQGRVCAWGCRGYGRVCDRTGYGLCEGYCCSRWGLCYGLRYSLSHYLIARFCDGGGARLRDSQSLVLELCHSPVTVLL